MPSLESATGGSQERVIVLEVVGSKVMFSGIPVYMHMHDALME